MAGNAHVAIVAFGLAGTVLLFRRVPPLDNLPAMFLGVVTCFAAGLPPTPASGLLLGAAVALGAATDMLAQRPVTLLQPAPSSEQSSIRPAVA